MMYANILRTFEVFGYEDLRLTNNHPTAAKIFATKFIFPSKKHFFNIYIVYITEKNWGSKESAYYIVPKTEEERDHHGIISREQPDNNTIKMKYFSLLKEHIVHYCLIFAPTLFI